jgi:hypothetical protein
MVALDLAQRSAPPPNYQVQRRHAPNSTRARSARVLSALGRPRPSTLCLPVRCNAELGDSRGVTRTTSLTIPQARFRSGRRSEIVVLPGRRKAA